IPRVRPRSRAPRIAIRPRGSPANGSAPRGGIKRGPQTPTPRHSFEFRFTSHHSPLARRCSVLIQEKERGRSASFDGDRDGGGCCSGDGRSWRGGEGGGCCAGESGGGEGGGCCAGESGEEVKEAGAGEEVMEVAEGEAKEAGAGEEAMEVAGGEEKKPRSRKPRSAGPHHPPYFEMIKEAIMAAGDGKAGASAYAIAKRVGERHGEALPGNYRKVLAAQLRSFAAKGRLVRVKASFRLAPAEEKKALPAKKTTTNKAASKKARPKRAKRAGPPPAKPKPKQPKSIRARKANKASA
uniref:H15 domain-containing protein n=1 Tax=Aegilops tauschii subsp. strangulata TaxID=200361 RepID=A0A453QJP8_AEGTS